MLTSAPATARKMFARMRASEFGRLDAGGTVYLDYAGSGLSPDSLVRSHADRLCSDVLGNPHSDSPTSRASTRIIDSARERVLDYFDADPSEYTVVFTANTSAAVRLVAESFPFATNSALVLSSDNHNSVNGIREYASRAGSLVSYAELDADLRLTGAEALLGESDSDGPKLFAFPAQSNFSGVQHPLSLIRTAQCNGFRVFLDAAAFVPTHRLSLRTHSPDFVALSFYKMFGYPTGVGALSAPHDALDELKRPWFAGGTVDFVSVQNRIHRIKGGMEGFEDGTANFAAIGAVKAGLDFMSDVGIANIENHVSSLTTHALEQLGSIDGRHGGNTVILYGPRDMQARGATIAFNLVDGNGDVVPYEYVEAHARAANISIRGGCFCNPGASEHALAIPASRAFECMSGDGPFSIPRLRECIGDGTAVGALRCSFGMPTNHADVTRLVELIETLRPAPIAAARPSF